MIKDLFAGASYALAGFRLLGHRGLRAFVVWPLAINVLLFIAMIAWAAAMMSSVGEALVGFLPGWLDWLSWLIWPLFALAAVLVLVFFFTLVGNLVASPFNGLLAERTEALLDPGRPPPAPRPLLREIATAPVQELAKITYFVAWAVLLLPLFLVPGINVAAPFVWAFFGAWMLGLEYADFPMGNHGIAFRRQRAVLGRRRGLVLGFGGTVMLLTALPLVNLVVIPAAVIGATRMWVAELRAASPGRL